MPIVAHRDWPFEDPLIVVGFPSQGLLGAIVASYCVPKLDMKLVATMDSPGFAPVASVRDGAAMAPVQFFASAQQCGLDGECSQLIVVRSDVQPEGGDADAIATEILQWSLDVGAEKVVSLEGAPIPRQDDRVFAVPNLICQVDHERLGSHEFPNGALSGLSAALLTEGNALSMEVMTLFTGVDEEKPDAGAAARVVEIVDKLVPGIFMDPEPLEEQAMAHEEQLKESLQEQAKAQDASKMMYG